MPDMRSLLIANRGEIAVRIIRSAQEMGLRTVAVYSELDRDALHVDLADEAWNIGPAPAAGSYLNMDRIIAVAREAKADAIHPGYGFLAENATFAQRVIEAGIIWVGPPPDAIATMGDKIASRKAAAGAKVDSVPGTLEPLASVDDARAAAAEFGYPVAIKAAHGGGGKGLRVAYGDKEAFEGFSSCRNEARARVDHKEDKEDGHAQRYRPGHPARDPDPAAGLLSSRHHDSPPSVWQNHPALLARGLLNKLGQGHPATPRADGT